MANQLEQLYTDFTRASKSGELPNVEDLATALGRNHRGHGHAHGAPKSDAEGNSDGTSSTGSDTNALDIIQNTLAFQSTPQSGSRISA